MRRVIYQPLGKTISDIIKLIFAGLTGMSLAACLRYSFTLISFYYACLCIGSGLSCFYLNISTKRHEILPEKQTRLEMLWLLAGTLIKSVAFYLAFAGLVDFDIRIIWAMVVFEVFVYIYSFFVIYADEEKGHPWLLALKPFIILKEPVETRNAESSKNQV